MKQIILLLLLAGSLNGSGQTFYRDSVLNKTVANILLTDSASQFYALPLKMHVDVYDRMDSVNGATFTFYLYSMNPKNPALVSTGTIGISGKYYNNWDANNDKATYQIIQGGLANQNISVSF